MATTSEIKITEAYIGLLGRAPDPDGLKYWADALDAAGGTDVALKKLTKDITLSAEWASGLGSNDTSTRAGADAVVKGQFNNLFGYDPSQADYDYYSPKLMAGEFTASSMVVVLIQGADTTDAATLGFKQQAATYYVETVTQADFNVTNATAAVSSVDGPLSLKASKEATDALATGSGNSLVIGTDTIAMTLGDDNVTGEVKAGAYVTDTTAIQDASGIDEDTLTLSATDDFAFGVTEKVETITVNAGKALGNEFDIDFAKVDNDTDTININLSSKVTIAGVQVDGTQDLDLDNVRADVNTTNAQDVDIDFDSDAAAENVAHTVKTDATADTITIAGANDAGITLIMANDAAGTQTVSVSGEDGTNDALTISANNTVALNLNASVPNVTLSGNTNDVTYTITATDTNADTTIALTGSKDITIAGDADQLTGTTITDARTGTSTLKITANTSNALDGSKFALLDNIDYAMDANGDTLTLKSGQPLELSNTTQNGVLTLVEAGTTDAAGGTITVTLDGGTANAFNAGQIDTSKFEELKVSAGNSTVTNLIIDTDTGAGNDASVTVVGTNDITFADDTNVSIAAGAENVTVNAKSITVSGDVNGNDISLTATGGGVTATAEGLTATENGSILVSATGPVKIGTANADNGNAAGENVTITGNDVDFGGTLKGYDVTLTATNDSETSTLAGALTIGNTLKFTDGGWDTVALTATTGSITISGDAEVDASDGVVTAGAGVVITSTNDTDLSGGLVTPVLNAASASGAVKATLTGNGGQVTALTGSGNDNLTLNDAQVFTVETNGGRDTVTVTNVAASTTIKTGADIDTINASKAAVVYTVDAGEGDDIISVVADSDATIDAGAGTDKVNLANGNYSDDDLLLKNIEEVVLDGALTTISAGQFANDNTFELSADQAGRTLKIVAANTGSTIDASNLTFDVNAVGNLDIDGDAAVDTLTGSDVTDVISGEGGNDVINGGAGVDTIDGGPGADNLTGGGGADTFKYDTGNDEADTITDFVSGTDVYDTSFQTTKSTGGAGNAIVSSTAASTAGAQTWDSTAHDVIQRTGATLSASDAADEQKVIDAISNGTINVQASAKYLLVIETATNTYLYEVTCAGGNTTLTAADDAIVLVGTFTNSVQFATGDFTEDGGP